MDEQTLQTKIDMLEARIAFLEQQPADEGGAVREDGHAWPIPTLGGGGGGGSGSLADADPDDVSVDLRDDEDATDDGKLQIKDWDHATPPAAATTIAEDLASYQSTDKVVSRQSDKVLKYKAPGRIISGDNSNVVINTVNGNLKIDVYYV